MARTVPAIGWTIVFGILIALAVPWFLWGDARVVAGLPLWLWWHVGWMLLATAAFAAFARRGWNELMGVQRG